MTFPEGGALVYCEGAYASGDGKTAHGLVRRTRRYEVVGVIDSQLAGRDAGEELDGRRREIPILADLDTGLALQPRPTHLVMGLAPDGGHLPAGARADLLSALEAGLHLDSGLHDFLSEDAELAAAAKRSGARIRDIRRPPHRDELHAFTGKIGDVQALKVAVLGTDAAVGKRTTSWELVDAFERQGMKAELVGTGQTAWLQGVSYSLVLDSLVNDFVAGEIEHAVWSAWNDQRPDAIIIEGQGSLMNPAYPGGYEILAAGRPDAVILQHAPARKEYDGFPGHPLHPLETQIQAVELVSGRPVVAIALNREGMANGDIAGSCRELSASVKRPVVDVLGSGPTPLLEALRPYFPART